MYSALGQLYLTYANVEVEILYCMLHAVLCLACCSTLKIEIMYSIETLFDFNRIMPQKTDLFIGYFINQLYLFHTGVFSVKYFVKNIKSK
jgi:hypothetical protein